MTESDKHVQAAATAPEAPEAPVVEADAGLAQSEVLGVDEQLGLAQLEILALQAQLNEMHAAADKLAKELRSKSALIRIMGKDANDPFGDTDEQPFDPDTNYGYNTTE